MFLPNNVNKLGKNTILLSNLFIYFSKQTPFQTSESLLENWIETLENQILIRQEKEKQKQIKKDEKEKILANRTKCRFFNKGCTQTYHINQQKRLQDHEQICKYNKPTE